MSEAGAETVLVTGGNGFVGSWCIVEALRAGYAVRTTLRDPGKQPALRAAIESQTGKTGGLTVFKADLTDDGGWAEAMKGCDHVLHVASPLGHGATRDRMSLVGPARDGTLRVLKAAADAGVKRVVMTSAAAAARPPLSKDIISDETIWADPDDPQFDAYRVSKILAEKAAWDFIAREGNGMQLTTILPGAVFGPALVPEMRGSVGIIGGLLKGEPRALPRLGFWVVDVRDLAALHVKALREPKAAGERFIAAGEFLWMEEIAAILRDGLGVSARNVPTRRLPGLLVKLLVPFSRQVKSVAPLIGRRFRLTSDKARRTLGFAPRPARQTIIDCGESIIHFQKLEQDY